MYLIPQNYLYISFCEKINSTFDGMIVIFELCSIDLLHVLISYINILSQMTGSMTRLALILEMSPHDVIYQCARSDVLYLSKST